MAPADAAPQEQRLADTPADGPAMSVGQLAHELNSLLDGSLRTLGLALRQLEPVAGDRRKADEVVFRLQTARDAMWQMAELLERAMQGGEATSQMLSRTPPLRDEVPRILALVEPLAETHDVSVRAQIGPEAGELPIGPLGAVLLNGLRNAVQACVRGGRMPKNVSFSADVERGELVIQISDTGPGEVTGEQRSSDTARSAGHGLGLGLCRQIVSELDGRLELMRHGAEGGAVLRVEVPVRSLSKP